MKAGDVTLRKASAPPSHQHAFAPSSSTEVLNLIGELIEKMADLRLEGLYAAAYELVKAQQMRSLAAQ